MQQKPRHADDGTYCPQWRKPCVKVCHTCAWWTHVRGKHPQTNADVDKWACAIAMMPMLTIEGAMATRQATASVDSLRDEVRTSQDAAMVGAIRQINDRLRPEEVALPDRGARLLEGN